MELKATHSALDRFGEQVVGTAKNNLKRKNKSASGKLINSIDYDIKVHKNSFSLSFEMEDYWEYVDAGVEGVGGTKADGTKWKKKKVSNVTTSRSALGSSFAGVGKKFRYRKKKPPFMAFNGWTIRRGIAPRSKKGRFTKRRGLLYAIATSVYHTGIETTGFFRKPFNKEFRELPDELIEAYSLDVDGLLEHAIK